ncbi:histone-like nucleoid-structuring protein Lsr2 [Streptomyces sp. NPDC087440]|uniref:Lsr2 family DNA-binding protein n=1 Tax=Streptomyces sp. NPDC087440 TaxID=3365790 RepID=UPI00382FA7D5
MQQLNDTKKTSAFEAMALSMHGAGHPLDEITQATGLTEDEITSLVDVPDRMSPDTFPTPSRTQLAADRAVGELLAWAEGHPATAIRKKATRVRNDLTELGERRAAADAQRAAEDRVAQLKAELDTAQALLREVKAGRTPATELTGSPAVTSGTPAPGHRRSTEELAAIRAWARANSHTVASRGNPAKAVLDAYDAEHTPNLQAVAS